MRKKPVALSIAAVFAVVVVIAGILWLFPVLRVGQIEVTGNERVSIEAVIEDSGVREGDNLLRVDATGAASRIAQQPWVRGVTVSRHFPSTVNIEVAEREVVGYVEHDDGAHLIDHQGHAFLIDVPPEEAVEITGEVDDDDAVNTAVTAIATVPNEIRREIASLEISRSQAMELQLHDGRKIYWGTSDANEQKAAALEHVIHREGDRWDISNPSLVTVR